MATEFQTAPQTEQPDAPRPACCPWRTALQVPLLLCAAAGLGFAGQHAWHNRSDFQSLWPHSAVYTAGGPTCDMSVTHSEGCGATALDASCAPTAEGGCPLSAKLMAETTVEESVSALSPENAVDDL